MWLYLEKGHCRCKLRWGGPRVGWAFYPIWYPYMWRHRHTKQRSPCEDGGRGWIYAATSQGMPGATRSWKRQEKICPLLCSLLPSPEPSGRAWFFQHLDWGLVASRIVREYISFVWNHPDCGAGSPRELIQGARVLPCLRLSNMLFRNVLPFATLHVTVTTKNIHTHISECNCSALHWAARGRSSSNS